MTTTMTHSTCCQCGKTKPRRLFRGTVLKDGEWQMECRWCFKVRPVKTYEERMADRAAEFRKTLELACVEEIRRHPELAADGLRQLGWTCSPPAA